MIEVEVHSSLRGFLRQEGDRNWPHHLTMARLVARALRIGRSALVQTECSVDRYCLAYLTPSLLIEGALIIVAPEAIHQQILQKELPQLQEWLKTEKRIYTEIECCQEPDFDGVVLTTPQIWLEDKIYGQGKFPSHIPTIIDGAEDLETWARAALTVAIAASDWQEQIDIASNLAPLVQATYAELEKSISGHPTNPYNRYLLDDEEQQLHHLLTQLSHNNCISEQFASFWQQWQQEQAILWAAIDPDSGKFKLSVAPGEVATVLNSIWQQQPVIIVGSFLDWIDSAPTYRQQIGLDDILSLQFSPNRHTDQIQLYIPPRLPLPNTPEFQGAMMQQILALISWGRQRPQPMVFLVGDVPLKAQVGAILAAEFGSKVQVETTNVASDGILVCGWEWWREHRSFVPTPQLLGIATLPLPSLEDPLVAARVSYYKRSRQDWFRLYLLPTALRELQRAILPIRESRGVVALLDNRVNSRSYGQTILSVLEPCARFNYIDPTWFGLVFD